MQTPDVVVLVPGFLGFTRFGGFYYFADRLLAVLRGLLEEALGYPVPVVPCTVDRASDEVGGVPGEDRTGQQHDPPKGLHDMQKRPTIAARAATVVATAITQVAHRTRRLRVMICFVRCVVESLNSRISFAACVSGSATSTADFATTRSTDRICVSEAREPSVWTRASTSSNVSSRMGLSGIGRGSAVGLAVQHGEQLSVRHAQRAGHRGAANGRLAVTLE